MDAPQIAYIHAVHEVQTSLVAAFEVRSTIAASKLIPVQPAASKLILVWPAMPKRLDSTGLDHLSLVI